MWRQLDKDSSRFSAMQNVFSFHFDLNEGWTFFIAAGLFSRAGLTEGSCNDSIRLVPQENGMYGVTSQAHQQLHLFAVSAYQVLGKCLATVMEMGSSEH